MKKKLEAELISIAHRILQLKDKSDISKLQEEARQLYEKLTILSFTEAHFTESQPTIGQVRTKLETEATIPVNDSSLEIKVSNVPEKEIDVIPNFESTDPVIEEKTPQKEPQIVEKVEQEQPKNQTTAPATPEIVIEEINARVTEDLFIPASEVSLNQTTVEDDSKPKSLNDQLKKEIHIGLNDRLAFIKYLFEGSATDYNRVLSQLDTIHSKNEAQEFINNMIKPDYNNWKDKEEYEERFMDTILSKYNV